jgi:ABC-type transporter Mla maintaining outer membrane lipid asymmetry ATPase subunit MlaF
MRKQAGLARALALDPEIVFLDEPTAGLDPLAATAFEDLIKELRRTLKFTVVLVTHDLDTLYAICDRVRCWSTGRSRRAAADDPGPGGRHLGAHGQGPRSPTGC